MISGPTRSQDHLNIISTSIQQCVSSSSPVWFPPRTDADASPVTRSHKANDRNHAALADGTAGPEDHVPKYFAKHGFSDADPKKTKKNGGGKGNW